MRGWLAVIGRAKNVGCEVAAYQHLYALFSFFASTPMLDFDERAAQRFLGLRRSGASWLNGSQNCGDCDLMWWKPSVPKPYRFPPHSRIEC